MGEAAAAPAEAAARLASAAKPTPRSSLSSETAAVRITDSARNLGALGTPKPLSQLHSRELSETTGPDVSLRGVVSNSSGAALPSQAVLCSLLSAPASADDAASKMLSVAVLPPSEAGEALDAAELSADEAAAAALGEVAAAEAAGPAAEALPALPEPLRGTQSGPPASGPSGRSSAPGSKEPALGAAGSSRRQLPAEAGPGRKRLLDDSALEQEHSPGDPETLEKLWPLMAAVQRRQSLEEKSGLRGAAAAPGFRVTSGRGTPDDRSPRLTRAQAEFLGPGGRGGPAGLGGARPPPKLGGGFFQRGGSGGGKQWDSLEGLRLLDPRKERRMDPQERVRAWLEQGEQALAGQHAPVTQEPGSSPGRTGAEASQERQPSSRKHTLRQWLSCFAF